MNTEVLFMGLGSANVISYWKWLCCCFWWKCCIGRDWFIFLMLLSSFLGLLYDEIVGISGDYITPDAGGVKDASVSVRIDLFVMTVILWLLLALFVRTTMLLAFFGCIGLDHDCVVVSDNDVFGRLFIISRKTRR